MADLDFSHKVQQVPAGEALPEPKRTVGTEVSRVPDFQGAASAYAQNTNWMSAIGSEVAVRASTAIAKELGNNLGKNPQGDRGPALTDFDKVLTESYQRQAQATLGLQANKLINDANLQMSRAPRITPDLIAKTNNQVSLGLQNIFKHAPTEIRPHLEYQYGSQQISQASDLTERMIREQRQDRKANTAFASQTNAENAHTLAMKGDFKAADAIVETTRKLNEADVAAGISDKSDAKTKIDATRQSASTGRMTYEYEQARREGKEGEFLAKIADKKPDYVTDNDLPVVTSHLMEYINKQNNLRRTDANLARAKFNVALAENPASITPSQIEELKTHLNPVEQQEASLAYVKAIKALQSKTDGVEKALAVYTDINQFPLQSAENKNGAWKQTYASILQKPESTAEGLTVDTAKLYAAAAAPTAIPAYVAELNSKASTANPANLESAGQAVNYMRTHNLNQNLTGFGEQQDAMLEVYSQLRQIMPPNEAAQKAHETVYNKSKEQKEANKDALVEYYKTAKLKNENIFTVMRRVVETPTNLKIRNLPGYTQKVNKIFETYFNTTNGDEATASKLTKQTIDSQYGRSMINGEAELMFQPIENIPGIPHDAIGAIQSDIVFQTNQKFEEEKKLYFDGKLDHWWEARQKISPEEAATSKKIVDAINEGYVKHPVTGAVFDVHGKRKEYNNHLAITQQYLKGQGVTIIKHNRNGKEEVYEGMIQANPWGVATGRPNQPVSGGYDVMLKTENGAKSIPLMNPVNSNIQYNPRVDYIQNVYLQTNGLSTLRYALRPQDIELEKEIASHPERMKTL